MSKTNLEAPPRVDFRLPGDTGASVHDSEVRFRALVTTTSTAVYRMSPDWQEMRELTGQGFLEDTAQPNLNWIEKYIEPEDRARVLRAIAKAIAERSTFELEHRVRFSDGSLGWTLSRAVPILDAAGNVVEWFGAASDVTQKHNAVTRLRESEAGFKAIADTAPQLVWVTDTEGRLVFFNQRWSEYFGSAGEPENLRLFAAACIHPEDLESTLAAFDQARSSGCVFEAEHRLRGRDGNYRWFMARANPYVDEETGDILRWYGISLDVHERHNAESTLRTFNERLEVKVQASSRDLQAAEAQVRQMQKLEAIGQLTGGVAHDFNNLLTIIRNSAELLRRKALPADKQQRYLDAILDTADRAATLTAQLLAFARRQALKPAVFAVGERIEQIADMLRRTVGPRTRIVVRTPPGEYFVEADLNQFETALVNLVINARDAMHGDGVVTISLEEATTAPLQDGGAGSVEQVCIAVTDEGHGIAPEDIERVFEPFFTTKEVGKGTGLGLSQVYGFVRQSGGDVSVTSEPGRGSTFLVTLPRVGAPATSQADPATALVQPSKGRILVVEDNPQVGEFTVRLLDDMGYQACLASDAGVALSILEERREQIDLVLSDIVMPGMTGIELARIIGERWPDLPLVLTSGYSQAFAGEAQHGFELLKKPYSFNELLRALGRALKR